MSTKGKTRWFPRHIRPVRNGEYECVVQVSRSVPAMLWRLTWDGKGFIVPIPMVVHRWRGMTAKATGRAP